MARVYGGATTITPQPSTGRGRVYGGGQATQASPRFFEEEMHLEDLAGGNPILKGIDYLLQAPEYAYAGSMERAFEKAKKKKASGKKSNVLDFLEVNPILNPANWGGAVENLKPENRKTLPRVIDEATENTPFAALGFAGSLAIPSVPVTKLAKVTGLTKGIAKAGDVTGATKVVKKIDEATAPYLRYRGGQPKEYVKRAEQLRKESRQGLEKAKEVGELLSKDLTRGQQIRLGQLIKGGEVTAKTDKALVDRATKARSVIDDLSRQIVENAMKGQEVQVTAKGLAADLVNTLTRSFKKADPTLGVETKAWRSGDELAVDLLETLKKYQPARAKVGEGIGLDVTGKVGKGTKIVTETAETVPGTSIPSVPGQPGYKFPTTEITEQVPGESARLTTPLSRVQEGLPQRAQPRPILPVEKIQKEAETGGIKISDRTINTIDANIGRYLPRLYRKYEKNPEGLVKFLNTGQGKIVRDRFMKRSDIPDDVRALMGEILEPAYPAAKAVGQMSDIVAKSKFFRWVNDNFAQAQDLTGDMVQLSDTPQLGILAGKWVPKSIADDLTNVAIKPQHGSFVKAYNKALGAWKTGKVLLNPATRARNQFSNMILMDIVGGMPSYEVMNPKRWVDAVTDLRSKSGIYQVIKRETDLLDETFIANEIAPFLDDFLQQGGNALQRFSKAGLRFVGDSYQAQEQIGKMVLAKYWIENGKSIKEASEIAEKALFNYSKIPKAIEWLRQSPIGYPFITFSYFAIPATVKALGENPERIAKLTRTEKEVERQAEKRLGLERTGVLPEFIKDRAFLRLPFQKDGEDLYLDLNYILPWGNLLEGPSFYEPQNPVYTIVADLSRNKSSFTQKEIWKETDSNEDKQKKLVDYIYKTLMPSFAPGGFSADSVTRGGYSWQKFIDALRKRPDYYDRLRDIPTVLADTLLGLKATPIDPEREEANRAREKQSMIRDLENELKAISSDNRLFPDERERKLKQKEAQLQRVMAQ